MCASDDTLPILWDKLVYTQKERKRCRSRVEHKKKGNAPAPVEANMMMMMSFACDQDSFCDAFN